jgi:alkylation response protein AidB-like acyl-CoA dehydrogenase
MSSEEEFDADLVALIDDFFGAESDAPAVDRAEATGLSETMWAAAGEIGLTRIGLPETLGGAGGTLRDAIAVLIGSGRHAVAAPRPVGPQCDQSRRSPARAGGGDRPRSARGRHP